MKNKYGLPELLQLEKPQDFATKLRLRVFATKSAAASYFCVDDGTIGRYESESGILPPLGYIAGLMRLTLDKSRVDDHLNSSEIAQRQDFFLGEVRRLLRRSGEEYKHREPFHNWLQLCLAADSYRAEHCGTMPKTTPNAVPDVASDAIPGTMHVPYADTNGAVASHETPSQSANTNSTKLWPPSIPVAPYYRLPQREGSLASLLGELCSSDGPLVCVIDGLGGSGKTAFAAELCIRAVELGVFEGVVGESAKQEVLAGSQIVKVREAAFNLDSLLDSIAGQLGRWEITTLEAREKRARISSLLQAHSYLVLVDNLETAENASAMILHLQQLLAKNDASRAASRAVVTSRNMVSFDFAHSLSLGGLEDEDALFFLLKEAERRKVSQVLNAPNELHRSICGVTGGAPLALKLVVAQALYLDLEQGVQRLAQASGTGGADNLYRFIFAQSWSQLSRQAQRLLIYIGKTAIGTVSWEELASLPVLSPDADLAGAIEELVGYSLLDVSSSTGHIRYGIHQLTRQFVVSELPAIWAGSGTEMGISTS